MTGEENVRPLTSLLNKSKNPKHNISTLNPATLERLYTLTK
jgi:hypothetical protein